MDGRMDIVAYEAMSAVVLLFCYILIYFGTLRGWASNPGFNLLKT
jgi:hypothetical protein